MNLIRPLAWPAQVPRTRERRNGRFAIDGGYLTVSSALDRLEQELARMGATRVEVCADFDSGRGGKVSRTEARGADPGVVVAFERGGKRYELPCDTYTVGFYGPSALAQNIAAVAAHLEAIRAVERHGVATVDQLMGAFQALPAPAGWRELLGSPATLEEAEANYRRLARTAHPDAGGSDDEMARLNAAIAVAREELA